MHGTRCSELRSIGLGVLALIVGVCSGCPADKTPTENRVCPLTPVDEPAINTFLPELSSIQKVSASLAQSRGPDVNVEVPESAWADLMAQLTDSHPVTLECEMSQLATISIVTKNGDSRTVYVYDNFPPIVYAYRSTSRLLNFATDKPRDVVMAVFGVE